jgi:hypothetical protein
MGTNVRDNHKGVVDSINGHTVPINFDDGVCAPIRLTKFAAKPLVP